MKVLHYPVIDSTSTEARRLVMEGVRQPLLIIADEQTAGRGRSGHTFFSPPGSGLYMTLALPTDQPGAAVIPVTTMAAVAAAEELEKVSVSHRRFSVKWVNDIFDDRGKVCGILTELLPSEGGGSVVLVGVGINLTTEAFPPELTGVASAVGEIACTGGELATAIALRIADMAKDFGDRSYMESYRRHSCILGKEVTFFRDGRTYAGTASAIDDEARLLVKTDEGVLTLDGGEISVRLRK